MRRSRAFLLVVGLSLVLWGCGGDETAMVTTTVPELPASSTTGPTDSVTTSLPTSTTTSWVPSTSTTGSLSTQTTASTAPAPPPTPGREYSRLPTEEPVVALTFDAAYDPAPLAEILASLREAGIPGTFFLTGEFVEDFPESVRAIVQAGHPVGNHSYSHPDFTKIGLEETRRQLLSTAELLEEQGAGDPRPLFRPPFGARDQTVLDRLGAEGYVSVYWTIDTLDWKPERTPAEVKRAVLDGLRPGAIVLMHVGSPQTAQVLPEMIREIAERGYGFVTVPDGLGG
jgi:peptidoglycan-N-acetylglucosamine deacetylase